MTDSGLGIEAWVTVHGERLMTTQINGDRAELVFEVAPLRNAYLVMTIETLSEFVVTLTASLAAHDAQLAATGACADCTIAHRCAEAIANGGRAGPI